MNNATSRVLRLCQSHQRKHFGFSQAIIYTSCCIKASSSGHSHILDTTYHLLPLQLTATNTHTMRRTGRSSKRDQGRHHSDDDPNRPALTPMNTTREAATPTSMCSKSSRLPAKPSNVLDAMKGYSAVSDNPFFGEHSEFDLMHIKITVYGLSGILIERHSDKGEQPTSGKKGSTGSGSGMSSGSTITSCDDTYSERTEAPVYAVVTHKRNVSNSATSIASHLPSMPLGHSLSSFGNIYRHAASWPANSAPLIIDEDDECSLMDQSSFIMERVMMREPYDRQRFNGANAISCFVHETVDLEINLKRGNEMIPLGVTSLVVSGDEEGALKMNLPAKEVEFKGKKRATTRTKDGKKKKKEDGKKKHRHIFSKTADKLCFPSDKTKEYSFDENAALKIALQVIPHSSFIETEAAKERHADKEQRLLEKEERLRARDDNSMHDYQSRLQARLKGMHLDTPRSHADTTDTRDPTYGMAQFLCSPILCLVGDKEQSANDPGGDFPMDRSSVDSYLRERGVYDESSVLSSVSESESESEDENDPVHLLDTDIMVRKRTYA
jgi:hypothetical protein